MRPDPELANPQALVGLSQWGRLGAAELKALKDPSGPLEAALLEPGLPASPLHLLEALYLPACVPGDDPTGKRGE